jgi:amino acid adenylation domain-containing protein
MIYLLSHLLEQSAALHPERIAVEIDSARLSYAELADQVGRFAGVLCEHGLRPGDRVGVHLNKSLQGVVAWLGTLHAGGVFVPLDPGAPPQRTAYVLNNCRIRHLVTAGDKFLRLQKEADVAELPLLHVFLAGKAHELTPPPGVSLHLFSDLTSAPRMDAPVARVSTDLAYILYTSGSTGVPKGVMISHLAALTFVDWCCAKFSLAPDDVVSNHAPFHFDLSTFDVYASLRAGAKVVLLPEWASAFPARLSQAIVDKGITVWYSVPSALILMMTRGKFDSRSYPLLRTILFAGEVFPVKYLRELRRCVPHARLFNLYGPTETNVCTYFEVTDIEPDRVEPFPIGRAIDNHEVFAVTREGKRAAVGEEGELWARGPGLMSGYYGLPERTAQSFHENPFGEMSVDRVYRTGDLVKELPSGDYAYVGRIDHMVKVKGYRIELGEVEAALYSHDAVREAAVIAVADEELNARLKAFVVCADQKISVAMLQEHCAARIPKYMVPELVELREVLPKTSTGKIDRQLLTAEGQTATGPGTTSTT